MYRTDNTCNVEVAVAVLRLAVGEVCRAHTGLDDIGGIRTKNSARGRVVQARVE